MASTSSSVIDARKQYFYVSLFCFSVLLTGTEDFALSLFLAPLFLGFGGLIWCVFEVL